LVGWPIVHASLGTKRQGKTTLKLAQLSKLWQLGSFDHMPFFYTKSFFLFKKNLMAKTLFLKTFQVFLKK
jgi:hypothetical protein